MKYILIGDNDTSNVKHTILKNRKIKNVNKYLKITEKCLNDYSLLDNISEGVKLLKNSIENNINIYIVFDCDIDGYSSGSILYDYIHKKLNYKNVECIIHTGKQHGLSKDITNVLENREKGLIIIPDASTNDTEKCKEFVDKDFKILILDHHEKERDNDYAIIINNQLCEYPNKHLCGAGVVYKFLQALDDEYWSNYADEYLDIVGVANISDIMDLRDLETKYIVDIGIQNITHPLIKAIIKKQSFSIKDTDYPTINDIAFYVTPLMNSVIRIGSQEEKTLLLRAFIKEDNGEEFEYTPRKTKKNPNPEKTMENLYDKVARICVNTRARQSRLVDKSVEEIVSIYDNQNRENHICFINTTKLENTVRELSGLVAIKIADMYDKPCLVLRKDESKSTDDKVIFSGSARNINDGFIEDLKSELNSSSLFEFMAGHPNAFGVSIEKENIPKAINYINKKYNDIENGKVYRVDFIFNSEIDYKIIKDIYKMNKLFSNFVREPFIAIENVCVDLIGFETYGEDKKNMTWKFKNGLTEFIKFNVKSDDELLNIDSFMYDSVIINVVGKATINQYKNKSTPQFVVEEYEIIKKVNCIEDNEIITEEEDW